MSPQYTGVVWQDGSGSGLPVSAARMAILDQGVRDAIEPPQARAFASAAVSIANGGTGQAVLFNSEDYDTDSLHSTSVNTSRMTVVHAGEYQVVGGAEWAAQATAAGIRQLMIVKNATTTLKKTKLKLSTTTWDGEAVAQTISVVCTLAAGDYVELWAYQTSGGALNLSAPAAGVEGASLSLTMQGSPPAAAGTGPRATQVGNQIIETATGNPIYLRGGGFNVQSPLGNTMYKTVKTLLGANYMTIRTTWGDYEPTRPTGGDPALGGGNGETRNYDATMEAKLIEILDWCESEHVYNTIRTGHTGGDGMVYFDPSNNGWPSWLVDDAQWVSPQVAPTPADRANYGGPYAATNQGKLNSDTAFWVPFAGDSGLLDASHRCVSVDGHHWFGDADKIRSYLLPFLQHLQDIAQPYTYCLGFNWFNEPDPGELPKPLNFNDTRLAVHRMIKTQAIVYDALRATDAVRWQSTHGRGGSTYVGASTDYSLYWGGAAFSTCPSNKKFVHEWHWYPSGQSTLPSPYDQWSDSPYQNAQDSLAQPDQLITLTGFGGTDSFKLTYKKVEGATNFVRGTNATAAALQTALRAAVPDASLTVTGTTDAGPFTVHFTVIDASSLSVTSAVGCTGKVTSTNDYVGKVNDQDVYSPTLTGGLPQYLYDAMDAVSTLMTNRGIPLQVGEWGIFDSNISSTQFVIDCDNSYRRNKTHNAVFVLAGGKQKGILNDLGGDTYSLKAIGEQLRIQLLTPF